MAGRGRGRGSAFSYTAEVLGLGRGADAIPASVVQPPPLFPPLQFNPVPLASGEDVEYMLLLKQEFRGSMRDSPFFIKPLDKEKDIQRYSDKYQSTVPDDDWTPNWKNLPEELNYQKKHRKPLKRPNVKSKVKKTSDSTSSTKGKEIVKTLETLEKKEKESEAEPGKKTAPGENQDEDDSGAEEEDYYEEEDEEEGTDYLASYFDPGEEFLDDDDGNDDGPVY